MEQRIDRRKRPLSRWTPFFGGFPLTLFGVSCQQCSFMARYGLALPLQIGISPIGSILCTIRHIRNLAPSFGFSIAR